MNPHKWLLTAVECGLLFVRDTQAIASALVVSDMIKSFEKYKKNSTAKIGLNLVSNQVDPLYLKHQHPDAIDYRHWSEIFSLLFILNIIH